MAALGTLTAGVAHEIKNPLNFINNFSQINVELVEELQTDATNGTEEVKEETAFQQTLEDIKNNSERIHHHGKRMDAIVKGMLQHSRTGTTNYEEVDINALCEQSLRMAYHGYRTIDKSFNVKYETAFGPNLPRIKVISQDLGRVILNILNNAFYAVIEKRKNLNGQSKEYQPAVKLATAASLQNITITITDNGPGIPEEMIDKIFQPFFTTKPTGKGTGLGLSLSYDIITKGHGGELKVETTAGKGTTFLIELPNK